MLSNRPCQVKQAKGVKIYFDAVEIGPGGVVASEIDTPDSLC